MELQEIIRRAIKIGNKAGFITFDQLNELCPIALDPRDIEALMTALSEAGINVCESDDG
jgi:Sigma-70 factor, region 1.1